MALEPAPRSSSRTSTRRCGEPAAARRCSEAASDCRQHALSWLRRGTRENERISDSPIATRGARSITFYAHPEIRHVAAGRDIVRDMPAPGRSRSCAVRSRWSSPSTWTCRTGRTADVRSAADPPDRGQSTSNRALDWRPACRYRRCAHLCPRARWGVGAIRSGFRDVVYVPPEQVRLAARTQADGGRGRTRLNARVARSQSRGYVLVGPGRWGSSDPWLGVPVKWPQISEARVIVECGLDTFPRRAEPGGRTFSRIVTSLGRGLPDDQPVPWATGGSMRSGSVRCRRPRRANICGA